MKYKYLIHNQYDNEVDEHLHDAASWWLMNHDWDGKYPDERYTRPYNFLYITLWMPDEHHLHIIGEQDKCVITPYQVEQESKRSKHEADKLLLRWVREG